MAAGSFQSWEDFFYPGTEVLRNKPGMRDAAALKGFERSRTVGRLVQLRAGRCEPLSYAALARMFARRLDALGVRTPDKTPHALRHTHATAMWEGGMRELALQRRLGHASPESTRIYTRVSDERIRDEYAAALMTAPMAAPNDPRRDGR